MPSSELLVRIAAAQRGVSAQTELFHREFGRIASRWKADGTRVTAVDMAISDHLLRGLREQFPEDDFFSEELPELKGPVPLTRRFAWILDPVDGTNNYALGLVHCAISLALLEEGTPVYGVIYDLSRRALLHGGPGFGVFDGERPTGIRSEPPGPQSLLGFHSPYEPEPSAALSRLLEHFKIRALGSSTLHLAYVATGILGGVVDHNVKVWDIAAAVPLCWAGGGAVQFLRGNPFPLQQFDLDMARLPYVAGNAAMCARLRELLGA